MGILNRLMGRIAYPNGDIAPVKPGNVVTSVIAPQENYDAYSSLPNPAVNMQGDYKPNPFRVHGTFAPLKNFWYRKNQADVALERTPDVPFYTEMKTGVEIPPQIIYQPSRGVQVPDQGLLYHQGWKQVFVPQDAPRFAMQNAVAPVAYLSTPIHVQSIDSTLNGKRVPLKAKAPRPTKGVQQ